MKNKYHVILFTDGDYKFFHTKTLGAYRLATELRNHGYHTKVIDYYGQWVNNPSDLFTLLDLIVGDETLFIGFSSTFFKNIKNNQLPTRWGEYTDGRLTTWPQSFLNDKPAMDVIDGIRKKYPKLKLVYGGSNDHTDALGLVDFIVQGLADSTIIELANHLSKNTPLKFMQCGKNTKFINHNKFANTFDFKNSRVEYQEWDHIVSGEILPMETSRGCLFKCSFCDYPLIGRKKGDSDYHKTINTMALEFSDNYKNHQTKNYVFVDDTFNETTGKIRNVIQARDLSGTNFNFSCYLRADLLARFPEQIGLLKELGLSSAFLGIESLYQPSAAAIGKSTHPEKVKNIIYKLKEEIPDIKIYGSFIIGLPEDNPDTLSTWVPWVMQKDNPIDFPKFGPLGLNSTFVGSDISNFPEKYGYTIDAEKNWKNKFWDRKQAQRYSMELMNQAWENDRLKLASWELTGMLNYPGMYEKFKDVPLNKIDFELLSAKKHEQWINYKNTILSYENK